MSEQNFPPPPSPQPWSEAPPPPPAATTPDDRTFALLIHLSTFVSHFIGPLVLWLIKKDTSAFVDHHGKEALNFQLTMLGAWMVAIAASFCLFGFVLFPVIAVAQIVCVIIAAIKANEGVMYRYPFTIRLIN